MICEYENEANSLNMVLKHWRTWIVVRHSLFRTGSKQISDENAFCQPITLDFRKFRTKNSNSPICNSREKDCVNNLCLPIS